MSLTHALSRGGVSGLSPRRLRTNTRTGKNSRERAALRAAGYAVPKTATPAWCRRALAAMRVIEWLRSSENENVGVFG